MNIHKILLSLVIIAGAGCGKEQADAPDKPQANPTVKTATVEFNKVATQFTIPASVQADPARVIHVFAPVSGKLVALNVKAGDQVRAGQPVAILQSSDAASAHSDYEKAKAQAERSQSAVRRVSLLYQHEVVAARDFEDAKAQAASDESDLARTRERLLLLGLKEDQSTDKVTVVAPRSGVVIETASAAGEFSKSLDASNALVTIADLSSIWIVGNVYEHDLQSIASSATVTVTADAYPSLTWKGRISRIADVVDPTTHTVKVRVVLDNHERKFKPDMFAAIHINGPAASMATIPSSALLHEQSKVFVVLQSSGGKYSRREVDVEHSDAQVAVVRSGLQPGDVVVTSGAELLREELAR